MKELYAIEDALLLVKKKRRHLVLLIALGPVLATITSVLLIFAFSLWTAIAISFLFFCYISYVFTYFSFIRKEYNEAYHFLAKVEQIERTTVFGAIASIESKSLTLQGKSVRKITLDDCQVVYVEEAFADLFHCAHSYDLELIDGCVVAYRERET